MSRRLPCWAWSLALLAMFSCTVVAQPAPTLTLTPAQPMAYRPFVATLHATTNFANQMEPVTVQGNVITGRLFAGCTFGVCPPPAYQDHPTTIPPLAPGAYVFVVRDVDSNEEIARFDIAIVERAAIPARSPLAALVLLLAIASSGLTMLPRTATAP
jgi:hypothetical protein